MEASTRGAQAVGLALALGLALVSSSSAGAATTVGQTGVPTAGCGGDDNIVQASTDPAGSHTVPSDGVITNWSFRSGDADQLARMIVWRPTAAANDYLVVGKTDTETFNGTAVQTFPARVAVKAGDLLGMRMAANGQCLLSGLPPGNVIKFVATPASDVPDGSVQTMTNQLPTFRILVAASLEPDADADGFGDETQDQCLGQTGPVNGCAPPQPEPQPEPEAGDSNAPVATITDGPKPKTKKKTVTFEFTGTDARAVASFECSVDGAAFAPCTSPHTVKVKKGKHTFQVRAVDQAGNVGAAASDSWTVKKKKRKKK